jgi:hypothetical protein
MSDPGTGGPAFPPPPGWQPPPPPPPSYSGQAPSLAPPPPPGWPGAGAQPGAWAPAPGMLGAAHKPGAMPLRPLGLGDMYDAAFRIIRFNPKATVGSAVLVAGVSMAIPVLVTLVLTFAVDLSIHQGASDDTSTRLGWIGSIGSVGIGLALATVGTLLVTGMTSHVTAAAAIGRRLTLGEAWAATRGRRWRLIGLALLLLVAVLLLFGLYVLAWVLVVTVVDSVALIVVWGLVTVPAFLCLLAWFWVRVYYLPVPALMLEPVGVLGAIRRGYHLTRRQFWRTFGIGLLTLVVVSAASQVLTIPVGIIGEITTVVVGSRYALLVLVITQALSQVISAAFATPFTSAVTSLQYLDQRMRKEAFDVELMQQAGITGQ